MTRILFAPPQPEPILEIARTLIPPGYELVTAEPGTPTFYQAASDAEYYLGLARNMGGEFFRSAPRLKLVQLLSAGYDSVDIEAARKAGVPVSNNGGANAIAVAEHTFALMLAVLKRIVYHHNNVVSGKWRVGDFAAARVYELHGNGSASSASATSARRSPARGRLRHAGPVLRHHPTDRGPGGRPRRPLRAAARDPPNVGRGEPARAARRQHPQPLPRPRARPDEVERDPVNTCRGPVVDEAALHQRSRPPADRAPVSTSWSTSRRRPATRSTGSPTSRSRRTRRVRRGRTGASRFRNGFDNIQRVEAGDRPRWVIPELA